MGNRNLTYQFEIGQGNFTLPQPTFSLFMTKDPVANWEEFAGQIASSAFLKDHYNQVCLPPQSLLDAKLTGARRSTPPIGRTRRARRSSTPSSASGWGTSLSPRRVTCTATRNQNR